jgi:hypothetical protein
VLLTETLPDGVRTALLTALAWRQGFRLASVTDAASAAAERALTQPFYNPGGAALLAKLGALPLIPQVNQATSMAQADLMRQDRGTYSRPGGGNRS